MEWKTLRRAGPVTIKFDWLSGRGLAIEGEVGDRIPNLSQCPQLCKQIFRGTNEECHLESGIYAECSRFCANTLLEERTWNVL